MSFNKGKRIHRMPKEVYRDNLYPDIWGIPTAIFAELFILWMDFMIISARYWDALLLFAILTYVFPWGIITKLGNKPLTRFEIYENGFVPAVKPARYYLQRKEFFVPFAQIFDVSFLRGGFVCILHTVGSNREIKVSIDDHDLQGYVKFLKLMAWKHTEFPLPDLDIIVEDFYGNIKRNLGDWWNPRWVKYHAKQLEDKSPISGDEFLKIYYKALEVNPEVGPVPLHAASRPGVPICRNCGEWLDYIREYDRWYCPACQEYVEEPPVPPERSRAPSCPYCNNPLAYIPEYDRWYCYNCQEYVPEG